tara:strand:- start:49571 stop:50695 length:1125 start_codon:yes stop_codon:yes gene_type:complete
LNSIKRQIPLVNLEPEISFLREEYQAAFDRVLKSGRFILGPEVEAFEHEVASYLGAKHVISVNSGTDALIISLRSIGIGPGDEVITTPFTFVATAEAICTVGATPIFADINPVTFNIDPKLITPAITPRTKAILPVHLFGLACEMDEICGIAQKNSLAIIEDTAQSFGGRYKGRSLGTIGDVGAFSLFPTKNLGAFGDGGLIATNQDDIADLARKIRSHGGKDKYRVEMLGCNSRLDELQAAFLRVKLPYVDEWNEQRRQIAYQYFETLKDVKEIQLPYFPEHFGHVFHQFTIRVASQVRNSIQAGLQKHGISTACYYKTPLHRLPLFASAPDISLLHSDQAAEEVLSLPMGAGTSSMEVETVIKALGFMFSNV